MAVKKTAESAKEAVKNEAEVIKEAVKTEVQAVKNADKAAEKKVSEKAGRKTAEKKAPAKKTSAKPDVKKETVYLQFAGKEIDIDSVAEAARADFKANNKGYVRKLEVYVKPEDCAAYYVVNGKISGKIEL